MTSFPEAKAAEQRLERMLDIGMEELRPIAGVTYVACGICRQGITGNLPAFIVAHIDEDDNTIIDVLRTNISEDKATAVARRYGPRPIVHPLDDAGLPLVQVFGIADMLLRPKPPHYCASWWHMLVYQRICELRDLEYRKSASIWEDGVMVRELPYDGARLERLINDAIECFERDDLERADRYCMAAERVMVGGRP
jgi:hypothetical protein